MTFILNNKQYYYFHQSLSPAFFFSEKNDQMPINFRFCLIKKAISKKFNILNSIIIESHSLDSKGTIKTDVITLQFSIKCKLF